MTRRIHLLYASIARLPDSVACSTEAMGLIRTFDPDLVTCKRCRYEGYQNLDAVDALQAMEQQYGIAERMERDAIETKNRIAEAIDEHKKRQAQSKGVE